MRYNNLPDLLPAPKEVGGVWPWRKGPKGGTMRYCFMRAYEGITKKAFAALFKEGGDLHEVANHDYMLKKLRIGNSGKSVTTHTWKLDEEGIRLKIYDVKYLLKKRTRGNKRQETANPALSRMETMTAAEYRKLSRLGKYAAEKKMTKCPYGCGTEDGIRAIQRHKKVCKKRAAVLPAILRNAALARERKKREGSKAAPGRTIRR